MKWRTPASKGFMEVQPRCGKVEELHVTVLFPIINTSRDDTKERMRAERSSQGK
jgi:hypothetical protein